MRTLLLLVLLAPLLVGASTGPTSALASGCQFVLGFKALHDLIPAAVGDCAEDEQHNPTNGDGLQSTSGVNGAGGLLVWRKADNWTAYTDGYRTWINGPCGLTQRLNTQRFPWEGDAGSFSLVYDGCSAAPNPDSTAPPTPTVQVIPTIPPAPTSTSTPAPPPTATPAPAPPLVQLGGIAFPGQPGGQFCQRDYSSSHWTSLSFRVIENTGDISCSSGQKDTPGISTVDFLFSNSQDPNVYENLEHNAAYCAFPSDDPSCPTWVFASHGNKWPNGKVVSSGDYTLSVTVTFTNTNTSSDSFPFTITLPGG